MDLFGSSDESCSGEQTESGVDHAVEDAEDEGLLSPAPPSPLVSATLSREGGKLPVRHDLDAELPEASQESKQAEVAQPRKILPITPASADDEDCPLVIDCGSSMCKGGFAGADAPHAVFPTVVGRPKFRPEGCMIGMTIVDHYVGDDAIRKRGILTIRCPVERGLVEDWDNLERVWHHLFYNELRVSPEEHPVLLTEPSLNPKANRERMTQIMFETFGVPVLHVCAAAVLVLAAQGWDTGLVLDSGLEVTSAVPVFEGHVVAHAVRKTDAGGRTITDFMGELFEKTHGDHFTTSGGREILNDIKEKLGYVALDFEAENKTAAESSSLERSYDIPWGGTLECRAITLCREHFHGPEVMFRPELHGLECDPVHRVVHDAAITCDVDIQAALLNHVVLAGGNTMFDGFATRLERELSSALAQADLRGVVKVVAPPERKYSVWIGGSIFAMHRRCDEAGSRFRFVSCLPKGRGLGETEWMTMRDYDEHGPTLVHGRHEAPPLAARDVVPEAAPLAAPEAAPEAAPGAAPGAGPSSAVASSAAEAQQEQGHTDGSSGGGEDA